MISKEAINSTVGVVDRCRTQNIRLSGLDDSILGVCIAASLNNITHTSDEVQDFAGEWVSHLDANPIFGGKGSVILTDKKGEQQLIIPVTEHTATMSKASDIIADTTLNARNVVMNVVRPNIERIMTAVETAVNDYEAYSEDFEIVDVKFPAMIWEDSIITHLLENFSGVSEFVIPRADIPTITLPNDYLPTVHTGTARVDSIIQYLLDACGLEAREVVDSIFNGNDDPGRTDDAYYADANIKILKLLVLQWLENNPVPNSGLSNGDWKLLMMRLSKAYGTESYINLKTIEENDKQNMLFLDFDYAKKAIFLNSSVYDRWLDQGGTPEVILGAALSNQLDKMNYQYTLEHKSELLSAWESEHAIRRTVAFNERIDTIRSSIFNAILNLIEELDESELQDTKQNLVRKTKELISKVDDYHLNEPAGVVTELVCDVLYSHLPAKAFLNIINTLDVENMSIDAILLESSLAYVTNWVASSIVYED